MAAFCVVLITGCNTSKAFTKRAKKLEEAGLTTEAADSYYTALWKNRNNVDAQIGMKNIGQQVVTKRLSEWTVQRMSGDLRKSVYDYLDIQAYQKKISQVGIELEIPSMYQQDFQQVKIDYLHDVYEEGSRLLEAEQFTEAEVVFKEISLLDPGFRDAGELKDIAYLEPLYIDGVKAMDVGQWRTAHEKFDQVIKRRADYKDAAALEDEVLRNGQFTMAMMPFENATGKQGLDAKAEAYSLQTLTQINDPFLKVVNRDDLDAILNEQHLSMTGLIDEETATEVGELLGAQAILRGTVISHTTTAGRPQQYNRDGYESYKVKRFNKSTQKYYYETKYNPVTYKEHYLRNSARVSFQYRIVSLQTGEILLSEIVEKEVDSEASYITYSGDLSKLMPASNGGVDRSQANRRALRSRASASREVKSTAALSDQAFEMVTNSMKVQVEQMMREVIE